MNKTEGESKFGKCLIRFECNQAEQIVFADAFSTPVSVLLDQHVSLLSL